MRRHPFNTGTTLLAWAATLASVLVMAWPADADAFVDYEALWGHDAPSSCVNMAQLSSHGQLSLVDDRLGVSRQQPSDRDVSADVGQPTTRPAGEAGCAEAGEPAGPDNFCFESAGAPHSLRPTLLAKLERARREMSEQKNSETREDDPAQAEVASEEMASETVAVVQKMLGVDGARDFAAFQLASGLQLPAPKKRAPEPTGSCTIQHPDNCRSMPPLPGELQLEVLPSIAQLGHDGRLPQDPPAPPSDSTLLTRLRVGPSAGHDSPPDKPPRLR